MGCFGWLFLEGVDACELGDGDVVGLEEIAGGSEIIEKYKLFQENKRLDATAQTVSEQKTKLAKQCSAELEAHKKRVEQLQQEHESIHAQMQSKLTIRQNQIDQLISTHENETETLQQQMEQLISTHENETETLQQQMEQLQSENAHLQSQIQQSSHQNSRAIADGPKQKTNALPLGAIDIKYARHPFEGVCRHLERVARVSNLHEAGIVTNTPSEEMNMDHLVKLTDLSHNNCWFGPFGLNSWVSFDFRQRRIALSAYSIKSGYSGYYLRSWAIEGSNRG